MKKKQIDFQFLIIVVPFGTWTYYGFSASRNRLGTISAMLIILLKAAYMGFDIIGGHDVFANFDYRRFGRLPYLF